MSDFNGFNCDSTAQYSEYDCATDEISYGRVITLGVIWDDSTIKDDLNDPALWQQAVTAGEVAIIKGFIGSYDGGTINVVPGYGKKLERIESQLHNISGRYVYQKKNIAFFNTLMSSSNKGLFFISGADQEMHVVLGVDASFKPQMPITEELEKTREYQLDVSWTRIGLPLSYDVGAVLMS